MNPAPTRRELLLAGGAAALCTGADARAEDPPAKVYRIGVISASIDGKPQKTNGHTWHFAQYFHPTVNFDALKKYLDPGSFELFRKHLRNPKENFDVLPFADTLSTPPGWPGETVAPRAYGAESNVAPLK